MENSLDEELLESWLQLSVQLNNARIVSKMPFNTALICNLLWNARQNGEEGLSQTELVRRTGMDKSLMSRTLRNMEKEGYILRSPSAENRHVTMVRLNPEEMTHFEQEHCHSLEVVAKLREEVGEENGERVLEVFRMVAAAAGRALGRCDD